MNKQLISPEQEYELLSQKTLSLKPKFTTGRKTENLCKNRYRDILALEDTRVHIPAGTTPTTDYINANFVKTDSAGKLSFICTQAPLLKTAKDFWLMVWHQHCGVICALNRLIENKTIKGDRYWPEKKKTKQKFGDMTIYLIEEFIMQNLDITIRRIKMSYHNSEREIYHLHYEGWPDFGVPKSSLPIRELVRLSVFYQKNYAQGPGPIVVHCSAGIGRSGSFMVIATIMTSPQFHNLILENYSQGDHLLHNQQEYPQQPQSTDYGLLLCKLADFRISDIVFSLRKQRHPGIVQTKQQYTFIYSSLLDELCTPTTISEACCKVIQWHSAQKNFDGDKENSERANLSQSGPVLKSYEKEKNYCGFLEENTSNDLAYIFNNDNNMKENKKIKKRRREYGHTYLMSSGTFPYHQDRSFLCKSSPMVFVL